MCVEIVRRGLQPQACAHVEASFSLFNIDSYCTGPNENKDYYLNLRLEVGVDLSFSGTVVINGISIKDQKCLFPMSHREDRNSQV